MELITLAFRIFSAIASCDPRVADDVDDAEVAECQEVEMERIGLVAAPVFDIPASDDCGQW